VKPRFRFPSLFFLPFLGLSFNIPRGFVFPWLWPHGAFRFVHVIRDNRPSCSTSRPFPLVPRMWKSPPLPGSCRPFSDLILRSTPLFFRPCPITPPGISHLSFNHLLPFSTIVYKGAFQLAVSSTWVGLSSRKCEVTFPSRRSCNTLPQLANKLPGRFSAILPRNTGLTPSPLFFPW